MLKESTALEQQGEYNRYKFRLDRERRAIGMLLDLCPDWDQRTVADKAGVAQQLVGEVLAYRAAKEAAQGKLSDSLNFSKVSQSPKKGQGSGGGRKNTKVNNAQKIALALKADHQRPDDVIAHAPPTESLLPPVQVTGPADQPAGQERQQPDQSRAFHSDHRDALGTAGL